MDHPSSPLKAVPASAVEVGVDIPSQPKRAPAEALVELLNLEGCSPVVQSEGEIRFVRNELRYWVLLSRADPEFVRVILPNFHAIGSDSERAIAYAAANVTNATCKAAKVYVERNQTLAVIECFLSSPTQLVPVLMRCAGALEHAYRSFAIAYAMQQRD